jgi:lipopolysaccharide export LptBFGC system permease protein LptF
MQAARNENLLSILCALFLLVLSNWLSPTASAQTQTSIAEVVPQIGHAAGVSSLAISEEGTRVLTIGYVEADKLKAIEGVRPN